MRGRRNVAAPVVIQTEEGGAAHSRVSMATGETLEVPFGLTRPIQAAVDPEGELCRGADRSCARYICAVGDL